MKIKIKYYLLVNFFLLLTSIYIFILKGWKKSIELHEWVQDWVARISIKFKC
jgi:hypothetical protein